MRSEKPADRPSERPSSPLAAKLALLEEMLEMTRKLRSTPLHLDQHGAEGFAERLGRLMAEVNRLDRKLSKGESHPPTSAEAVLGSKIHRTLERIRAVNADLTASIKAQQETIGRQIARLKEKRDLLDAYQPGMDRPPTLVDSQA